MKEKRSIILFYDLLQLVNSLDITDAGIVIKSLIDYELKGIEWKWDAVYDANLKYIYEIGKKQLDRGKDLFQQKYGSSND